MGHHQSRSSLEEIIGRAITENQSEEKIALLEITDGEKNQNSLKKPPSHTKPGKQSPKHSAPDISSSPTGTYHVQVASFRKRKDADRQRDQFRKDNHDAFVTTADLGKKGTWYRVLIGKFNKKIEADKLAEYLRKKKKIKGFVIKR